jgi:hypothetical protein
VFLLFPSLNTNNKQYAAIERRAVASRNANTVTQIKARRQTIREERTHQSQISGIRQYSDWEENSNEKKKSVATDTLTLIIAPFDTIVA